MHIEHVALWTNDLDRLRRFYETYFGGVAGPRYSNLAKQFASYFLTFDTGARLELMSRPELDPAGPERARIRAGYVHLAMSVGSEAAVDTITRRLRADGFPIVGEPRRTGDGYYESVVADPDGNLIEVTV